MQEGFPHVPLPCGGSPRPWKVASGDWRWFPSGRNCGATGGLRREPRRTPNGFPNSQRLRKRKAQAQATRSVSVPPPPFGRATLTEEQRLRRSRAAPRGTHP
ncbi:hypothetical protein SAMD00079811_57700 [Scytonema sp. HK-05]|uniref:hypothetical protein n=1 Tax=Scytonema sp. HK-05 TaxID=1137095 RepID=UPI000A8E034C|nr:hypothetical protein [Scytonema sp. HK-05]BAY48150.1 hypothetical protein SAMD00079811_57700 [Scytonema sp. HK-05]